jgi:hypothetical protein
MTARLEVRLVVCAAVLLGCAISAQEDGLGLLLVVSHPEKDAMNYSVVRLTCVQDTRFMDQLTTDQRPAKFLRNGTVITRDSTLVSVNSTTDVSILFEFAQDQEGEFSCKSEKDEESAPIGLAASPPLGFDEPVDRHFIIRSINTAVSIPCPIQPGALADRYTVSWIEISPIPRTLVGDTSTISYNVTKSGRAMLQCAVRVLHLQSDSNTDETYDGSVIVHSKVLSSLVSVEGATVKKGEAVELACEFTRGDTDFRLLWMLDGEEYVCEDSVTDTVISCTLNDTRGVLQIENTTVLGEGSHTAQCILEPTIPQEFTDDPSFKPIESMTRDATLVITGDGELHISMGCPD